MGESPCDSQAGGPTHRWLAAYTRPKFEFKLAEYCQRRSVTVFLPTYQSWRRWSDRKMRLQFPLFPSYVFVQVSDMERHDIVRAPGFLWYVRNPAGPIEVAEQELLAIRRLLASGVEFDPLPAVALGDEVEIVAGQLRGCRGFLLRKSGTAIVLQVSAIQASVRVQIQDPQWIRKARPALQCSGLA